MAGALVFPYQRLVLDITEVGGVAMLHMQHVSQHVETLLSGLALVDDDGVIEVATFNEVSLQQRLNVTHKNEGAGGGYLRREVLHFVDCGKL